MKNLIAHLNKQSSIFIVVLMSLMLAGCGSSDDAAPPANVAPVITAGQVFTVSETATDNTAVGTVDATDSNGMIASYSITAGNTGDAFAIDAAGKITVTDTTAIDYETATSFSLTITATDDAGKTSEAVVTVNVTDENDTAPVVATGLSFTVSTYALSHYVVGTVSAGDADTIGGITGFTITGTDTSFAIDDSGQLTVTGNPILTAQTYTVTVTATDGVNDSESVAVTIVATDNPPPVIDQTDLLSVTMSEDGSPTAFVAPTITATDADTMTWSTPGATNGAATVSGTGAGPTITYIPNADFYSSDSFVVNVTDGTSTVGVTVIVMVEAVNDAPVANADAASTAADAPVTIDVLSNDTDAEGDALTVDSVDPASDNSGTIVINVDGTLTYTPASGFTGEDSFSYTVSDTSAATASGTVTITVSPAGEPIDMAVLMGSEGGVAGIDDEDPGVYFYWSDLWNPTTGLVSVQDKLYDHAAGLFETILDENDDGLILNNGQWLLEGNIYASDDGNGGFDVEIRDPVNDNLVLAEVKLTASYVDLSGEPMSGYLNQSWQDAMSDPNAVFATGAKLITEYRFVAMSERYDLWIYDWCEFSDSAMFTTLKSNCNGVDVGTGINASGYAQTLEEVIVATAWTDPDDYSTPPADIQVAWEENSNKALTVELVTGGVANYYVIIDWNSADAASRVTFAATGTWTRNSVPGVDMIQFQIPAALEAGFPSDLEDGLNYFLTVQNGFVRVGQKKVVGDGGIDRDIFNGNAMSDILANFNPPREVTCYTSSDWDENANGGLGAPITPYSFEEYEMAVTACNSAQTLTRADVAGISVDNGYGETDTFHDTGKAATEAEPETGQYSDGTDTINFEWYVEAASCTGCTHNYLVRYTNSTIETTNLPTADFKFRETSAVISIQDNLNGTFGYHLVNYAEQSNYSDMVRSTGVDGEIYNQVVTVTP